MYWIINLLCLNINLANRLDARLASRLAWLHIVLPFRPFLRYLATLDDIV